jgi:hypothetical protein
MNETKSVVPECVNTLFFEDDVPVVRTVFPYGSCVEHYVRSFCKRIEALVTETVPGKPPVKFRITITNTDNQGIVFDSVYIE